MAMNVSVRVVAEDPSERRPPEPDDHQGDAEFQQARQRLRDNKVQAENEQAGDQDRESVSRAPQSSGPQGAAHPRLLADDRADGGDVVGLGRMLEAE